MNNNMGILMQALKNPQEFLQGMMNNNQMMQNPVMRNAFDMMQKGDDKGIEDLARNVCKERGINADDALKQIKSQFGM